MHVRCASFTARWRYAFAMGILLASAGCAVGPQTLKADQVEYSRALGDASKREILAMMVGLRYADMPGFLTVSQIIAAYTLDASGTAVLNSKPDPGGPHAGATGMVSYSNHPTFTFAPTTGDYFAKAYIHPLPPALILPLADSGIPIDLLLRATVQSIGKLRNATMLGGPTGNGSPKFFELLAALRRLQLAGEVRFRSQAGDTGQAIMLSLSETASSHEPSIEQDLRHTRRLLDLPEGQTDYRIVDDSAAAKRYELPMVTRSVLAILTDLGAEITVPEDDIRQGATRTGIGLVGGETRPVVVVHSGPKAPPRAYTSVAHSASMFWIDDADFDSKYALTLIQDLMALAQVTDNSHVPVVTVPAN